MAARIVNKYSYFMIARMLKYLYAFNCKNIKNYQTLMVTRK